jgi:hypothetical protein
MFLDETSSHSTVIVTTWTRLLPRADIFTVQEQKILALPDVRTSLKIQSVWDVGTEEGVTEACGDITGYSAW